MTETEFTTEELNSEEWRSIVDFEGLYEVSNLGRIRSLIMSSKRPADGIRKCRLVGGYKSVRLHHNSKKAYRLVHCLVATAFIGERPEGHQVNHKDRDCTNARLSNLEYVTPLQNIRHALENGHIPFATGGNRKRIPLRTVKSILQALQRGESKRSITQKYNVDVTTVRRFERDTYWHELLTL